jgi:hypothetical protein
MDEPRLDAMSDCEALELDDPHSTSMLPPLIRSQLQSRISFEGVPSIGIEPVVKLPVVLKSSSSNESGNTVGMVAGL